MQLVLDVVDEITLEEVADEGILVVVKEDVSEFMTQVREAEEGRSLHRGHTRQTEPGYRPVVLRREGCDERRQFVPAFVELEMTGQKGWFTQGRVCEKGGGGAADALGRLVSGQSLVAHVQIRRQRGQPILKDGAPPLQVRRSPARKPSTLSRSYSRINRRKTIEASASATPASSSSTAKSASVSSDGCSRRRVATRCKSSR